MRALTVFGASVLFATMFTGTSLADPSVHSSIEPIVKYFESLKLVPILVPRGQSVVDVYDISTLSFVYDHTQCFPTLSTTLLSTELPQLSELSKDSGLLMLGLRFVASAKVNESNSARVVSFTFTDVQVSTVTEDNLHRSYSPQNCPELQKIIDGGLHLGFIEISG